MWLSVTFMELPMNNLGLSIVIYQMVPQKNLKTIYRYLKEYLAVYVTLHIL